MRVLKSLATQHHVGHPLAEPMRDPIEGTEIIDLARPFARITFAEPMRDPIEGTEIWMATTMHVMLFDAEPMRDPIEGTEILR